MRVDPNRENSVHTDDWLEDQCRRIEKAGQTLALAVGQVNERIAEARAGELGKRKLVTESQFRQAEQACEIMHGVQLAVQNALFDCEHELRSLRERDVSPAELLIDGERLIRQYRFYRRRARVIDGLLAYLPSVTQHSRTCLEYLRQIHSGAKPNGELRVPDCGFALVALDQLREEAVAPGDSA